MFDFNEDSFTVLILFIFMLIFTGIIMTGCTEGDYTKVDENHYVTEDNRSFTTYDLADACSTAAQEIEREVVLDDYARVTFDGADCVIRFEDGVE